MVKIVLRLEALAALAIFLYFYNTMRGSWIFFALLLFVPDLSMLGYLINKKLGAKIYNLIHNYALAIAITVYGFASGNLLLIRIGLILGAHVSLDRILDFGLKYPSNFKDTHLQKV